MFSWGLDRDSFPVTLSISCWSYVFSSWCYNYMILSMSVYFLSPLEFKHQERTRAVPIMLHAVSLVSITVPGKEELTRKE